MASRFSLAAKLYSIFALFAVLVAAITVLSDYNTRQNAELTEAVSTASRAHDPVSARTTATTDVNRTAFAGVRNRGWMRPKKAGNSPCSSALSKAVR